jgi:hypothetical protein
MQEHFLFHEAAFAPRIHSRKRAKKMSTPQLKPSKPKVLNITRKDLEGREALADKARRLESESRQVRKLLAAIDDDIMRFVLDKAPKERTVNRSGFRLSILAKRKSVSWVTEFVKRLGERAKLEVAEAQPLVDRLEIVKL